MMLGLCFVCLIQSVEIGQKIEGYGLAVSLIGLNGFQFASKEFLAGLIIFVISQTLFHMHMHIIHSLYAGFSAYIKKMLLLILITTNPKL